MSEAIEHTKYCPQSVKGGSNTTCVCNTNENPYKK